MPSPSSPICFRIPRNLERSLKQYASRNSVTKSDVLTAALARYLGEESSIPMIQRLAEIEDKISILQAEMQELKTAKN